MRIRLQVNLAAIVALEVAVPMAGIARDDFADPRRTQVVLHVQQIAGGAAIPTMFNVALQVAFAAVLWSTVAVSPLVLALIYDALSASTNVGAGIRKHAFLVAVAAMSYFRVQICVTTSFMFVVTIAESREATLYLAFPSYALMLSGVRQCT